MATITLRIDDSLRDLLVERAQAEGSTLSDIIRDLLTEGLLPVSGDLRKRDTTAPKTLQPRDRQVLALLHRILARVLPPDSNDVDGDLGYQLDRATVLERGYTMEYSTEFAGIEQELSSRDCTRVMDILDMYRMLDYSIREADPPVSIELAHQLRFEGFDFNDPLEGHMADYVDYLLSQGRWEERRPDLDRTDNGNSHSPMLETYLRMLTAFRRIMDSRPPISRWRGPLAVEDLQAIADARVHPTRRTKGE